MTGALRGADTTPCSPVSSFRASLLDSGRGSVSPGVVVGRVDVAQVRPAVGAVEQEDLPSLGWLRLWRQCVCLPARALPRGRVAPSGAELTGLVLGESLAHCSVSGEPLRSFH